eukprot:Em0002g1875a
MNSRQASAAIAIIQGEASLLLAAMRRGSRWGGPSRVEDQDPLIQQLHQLQQRLASVAGIWELNGEFLKPFCDVVLSDDTSGPVTGMAISSVEKFLTYGMLDPTHPNSAAIIEAVSDAITHARFVGTNQTSDEVVLMKIVEVLHTILGAPVGRLLSNESVCELMQSCFRICFEMRLSELLRCFAESKLLSMVQMLFSCLHTLSEEAWGGADDVCSVDQTLHCEEETGEEQNHVTTEGDDENKGQPLKPLPLRKGRRRPSKLGRRSWILLPWMLLPLPLSPVSPKSIEVLLRLNLVCAALECSGPVVCQYQSLLLLIQDGLCRNLCTLLQHDNFAVFSRALKNCYILFICARQHLKLQLEMFLNILIDLISSENLKCPMDRRELALECVLQFCHVQHFAAEIFVNFDCQLYMSNVFENLTKVLSKNAFQVPSSLTPVHLMSLEALYAVMTTIQSGHTPTPFSEAQPTSQSLPPYQDDHAPIVHASSPSLYKGEGPDGHVVVEVREGAGPPPLKVLQAICQKKKVMLVATELFNKKASSAVEHLVKQGVFTSPPDPEEVASFLHDNQGLHKAMIGDYIGDRRNIDILNAYVGRFTVSGVDLVESLRHFLEAFRLPSESPIISRILETFTEHWLKCNEAGLGKVFANKDAVFVLAYSIIMLNVVLHSTKVKESMTLQTLLTRSQWPEAQYWEVATSEYDQDLFLVAWGPTVAAVSYVFDIAEDKNIVQKAIGGFSSMAFTIGINHKVRLSILTLFSLAHRHGNILREGWKNMLDCLIVLYKAKLLPESMVELPEMAESPGHHMRCCSPQATT